AGVLVPAVPSGGQVVRAPGRITLRYTRAWLPWTEQHSQTAHAMKILAGDTLGAYFQVRRSPFVRVGGRFLTADGSTVELRWTLYRDVPSGTAAEHNYTPIAAGRLHRAGRTGWSSADVGIQPPGRYLFELSEPAGGPV